MFALGRLGTMLWSHRDMVFVPDDAGTTALQSEAAPTALGYERMSEFHIRGNAPCSLSPAQRRVPLPRIGSQEPVPLAFSWLLSFLP